MAVIPLPAELVEAAMRADPELAEAVLRADPELVQEERAELGAEDRRRRARRARCFVPSDLDERLEAQAGNFIERLRARLFADWLQGLHPGDLTDAELAHLRGLYGEQETEDTLLLLVRVGYGARLVPHSRAKLARGVKRAAELEGLVPRWPRCLALRLPTTADTHRDPYARNDGQDIWGPVSCSLTLRPWELVALGVVGGMWHRTPAGQPYVSTSLSQIAHLVFRHAQGHACGKDLEAVSEWLARMLALELHAEVTDKPHRRRRRDREREMLGAVDSGQSEAHVIPSSPIVAVERWVGGRWVALAESSEEPEDADVDVESALEERAGHETVRIHLAPWVVRELAHASRRPVFGDLDVLGHLRPSGKRLYAYAQALPRNSSGEAYMYLGDPLLYTLGYSGQRMKLIDERVKADLSALRAADWRYENGYGPHEHPQSGRPAYVLHRPIGKSRAKPAALAGRALTRRQWREARLREAAEMLARYATDPARVRRQASEEHDAIRQAIRRSMQQADAARARLPRRDAARSEDPDPDR